LLAGNVIATVDENGVLRIVGDADGNRVTIAQLPPAGTNPWPGARYEIGDPFPDGRPRTTVNGQESVIVEGVKKGIAINLVEGDDRVKLSRPEISGRLASVPGFLSVNLGTGRDSASLLIINHREVNVRLGGDSDRIAVVGQVNELNVLGDPESPTANNRVGDDEISFSRLTARGAVNVDSGGGADLLRAPLTTTASSANLSLKTGDGNDSVFLGDVLSPSAFASSVRVETGSGDDGIAVRNFDSAVNITINTGTGSDGVAITDVSVDSILVWLAEDDDELFIQEDVVSARTRLGGGAGNDALTVREDEGSDLGELEIVGFETIN
jgi:hypothetical protein